MNSVLATIVVLAFFMMYERGYGQSKLGTALQTVADALAPQDTAKSKGTSGTGNLAVTDEGTPSEKNKSDKKETENPLERLQKKLTQDAQGDSGTGTGNLAVTDEGAPSDKAGKGKTARTGTEGEEQSIPREQKAPEQKNPSGKTGSEQPK